MEEEKKTGTSPDTQKNLEQNPPRDFKRIIRKRLDTPRAFRPPTRAPSSDRFSRISSVKQAIRTQTGDDKIDIRRKIFGDNEELPKKKDFTISVTDLMEAGCQFGHKPMFNHPKMKQYIYGVLNGVSIINLDNTLKFLEQAGDFLYNIAAKGGKILWVGTKQTISPVVENYAKKCGNFYVTHKWGAGLLTNFSTIIASLRKKARLEREIAEDREFSTKKEKRIAQRTLKKLEQNLAGLKGIRSLPDALFVVDISKEKIAIKEAQRIGIPVVAIVDTNSDPFEVPYPILSNDDSRKAVEFIASFIHSCIVDGLSRFLQKRKNNPEGDKFGRPPFRRTPNLEQAKALYSIKEPEAV